MDERRAQPGDGPPPHPDLQPGDVLAGMRIDGEAGRGGMGVVHRATDLALGRPVALKVIARELAEDPAFRERFVRETRVAAAIDHPNVIPVFSAGEDAGRLYIAMRLVDGADLRTVVRAVGPLSPERAAHVVAQVAAALDAAHARGVVHRDVKPANVLLDADDHVYLTDFGLAKRIDSGSRQTRAGGWVGTLGYVAPEQIRGNGVDARTDVYALGCVLFHALTATSPFARDSDEATLWAHLNDAPPDAAAIVPGVPAASAAVVARALAKDPADRFPSAGDLGRAALRAAGRPVPERPERTVATGAASPSDEPTRTSPTPVAVAATAATALAPASRRGGRRRAVVAAGTLVVAVGAVAGAVALGGGDDAPGTATPPAASPTPRQGAITGAFRAGRPNDLALDGSAVFAASYADDRVFLHDIADLSARRGPEAGAGVGSIAACARTLWVAKARTGSLLRYALGTGALRDRVALPAGDPIRIACSEESVWVAMRRLPSGQGRSQVLRFSTAGTLTGSFPVAAGVQDLAVGAGAVWVTNRTESTLTRIAIGSGLVRRVQTGARPSGVAVADGHVWVANAGDGTLSRYTTRGRLRQDRTVPAGERPVAVAAGGGTVVVSDLLGNRVLRFGADGTPVGALDGITNPQRVLLRGRTAWVASPNAGTVTRIAFPAG